MMNMTEPSPHYAGFWIRFLANMIDVVILIVIILTVLWWLYGPKALLASYQSPITQQLLQEAGLSTLPTLSSPIIPSWVNFLLNWILPLIFILIFWRYRSATPGKMLCGLKIVDQVTFQSPTTFQFIIRLFAYFISTLPLCLGFIWIAFDKRKQGWHDKIAKTVVIYFQKNAIR